jgi:ABC-type Fe3+-siderophore transport system permease subunit
MDNSKPSFVKNLPLYLYLVASIAMYISYIVIAKNKNILPSYTILIITVIIILCFASNIQYMATSNHSTLNAIAWLIVLGYIGLNSYGLYKLNLDGYIIKSEEEKQEEETN